MAECATSNLYLCIIWIYYRTSKLTLSDIALKNIARILSPHTFFWKTKSINAQFSFRGEENKTALKPTTALKQRGVKAIFCIRHKGTAVYLAIFYHFFIVFVVHVFNKIQSQEGAKFLRTSPLPSYFSRKTFPQIKMLDRDGSSVIFSELYFLWDKHYAPIRWCKVYIYIRQKKSAYLSAVSLPQPFWKCSAVQQ